MYAFSYAKPQSTAEAASLLEADGDAKALAGGMTLVATLKQRLAQPSLLVDLGGIAELRGIRAADDGVIIGAATWHAEVAASPIVIETIPALAELAAGMGDPQVRNRGTLGGSIANNDPASDYPAACLALNAVIKTNRRALAAEDFFLGMFTTALEDGEIIVEVRFPKPGRAAYAKFPNPASRYAIAVVFVAETTQGIRVAVTGAGACVFRVADIEAALSRSFAPDTLDGIVIPSDDLNSDLHASAAYRAHLVGIMAKRAVTRALERR